MCKLIVLLLLCGCAQLELDEAGGPQANEPEAPLVAPTLTAVAPGRIAVGDAIQVIGADLVGPERGTVALRLAGTFTDGGGHAEPYSGELPLARKNPSVAEAVFGPRVLFDARGDRTGVFAGRGQLVNRALGGGAEEVSEARPLRLEVGPSILIDELGSSDERCAPVSEATITDTNLRLVVRAIGLGDGPVTFRLRFSGPAIKAQFVKDSSYESWPPPGTVDQGVAADGALTLTTIVPSGGTLVVEPGAQERAFRVSPRVKIGGELVEVAQLHRLWTGPLEGQGPAYAGITVEAAAGAGSAARAVTLRVFNQAELLPFSGMERLVERYPAEQVTGCFPGGNSGSELAYTEGQAKTMTRSVSLRWDRNSGAQEGVQVGAHLGTGVGTPVSFGVEGNVHYSASWAQTFATDSAETVSSESHSSIQLSRHILPTYLGACYRQTERRERTVGIVYHNACGVAVPIGQATLVNWSFGFDVATGPSCPPPTGLPPPQAFP